MTVKKLTLVLIGSIVAMSTASAAAITDDEYVIVTASAISDSTADTVINVDTANTGSKTLPDLLRQATGIQVQDRPNAGGAEDLTIKLRGHDSRRFTVLVDGIPQRGTGVMGGSNFNWNSIPVSDISRIEIIKGAKAVAYGQTNGGVINIITKNKEGGELKVSIGSKRRRLASLNYNVSDNNLSFGFNIARSQMDAILRNADYSNGQYGFKLGYKLNKTDDIRFNFNHTQTKHGLVVANLPGSSCKPYYPTSLDSDAFASINGYKASDGSNTTTLRNSFDISWNSIHSNGTDTVAYWKAHEKNHEIGTKADGTIAVDRINVTDQSFGYFYQGTRQLSKKHELSFGADYSRLRYDNGWYNVNAAGGSALYPSQKEDVYGAYIGDTWTISNRWTAEFGVRYDSMKGDKDDSKAVKVKGYSDSSISPKLNLTLNNDSRTTTGVSINRIWRAPSMAEFYWYYQGTAMAAAGNHNADMSLHPERGWGYDISVKHQFSDRLNSKLALFYQDYSSFISFVHTKPFNCYSVNDVRFWGFEAEANYQLSDSSSVYFNYTNQHTAKDGIASWDKAVLKDQLDYRPRHILSLGYSFNNKDWKFSYDLNFTGCQNAIEGYPNATSINVVELGGYAVHNLSLTRHLSKSSQLNFSVYNLFDHDYCEVYGYPMEGRNYALTFTHKF